jgi:myb proto-oncogene protein
MLHWNNAVKPTIKQGPFNAYEKRRLRYLVGHHGEHATAWQITSDSMPGRTPLACLQEHERENKVAMARSREKERRIGNLVFTEEDVQRVGQLVLKHGQAWKKIAKEFGGSWGPQQIMFEWRKHLQSTGGGVQVAKKGRWNKEEDDRLVKAVAVHGRQWAKVAQYVPGRTEMQVRERYVNHLDPDVESSAPFTAAEEELVMREVPLHTKTGRIAWAKVASMLPGRTDRQVKKAYERLARNAKKKKRGARKGKGKPKGKAQPWEGESDDDGD